jgi:hypothetical protein
MSMLASVTTSAPNLPSRVVMYAPEKSGKTSWACHAPNPVFLMTAGETGLLSLIAAGQVPETAHFPDDFHNWHQLNKAVLELRDEKHDFKTLVLDTGNGAEQLLAASVCAESFDGDWKAYSDFSRGATIAAPLWGKFLAALDELRVTRRMSIIFLHHAAVKTTANPTGKDWDQHRPEAIKQFWGLTHKWADVICFYGTKVTVNKEDKAVGEQRFLRCNPSAAIVAGNRCGLPDEITAPPGAKNLWDAFAKEMGKAKAQAAKAKAPPAEKKPEAKPEAKRQPTADEQAKLDTLKAMAADGPELDADGNPIFPDKLFENPKKVTGVAH